MKVFITNSVKKRKYLYKTINLNETRLKGWEIATRWGNKAPIKDIDIDKKGNIFITIRKEI